MRISKLAAHKAHLLLMEAARPALDALGEIFLRAGLLLENRPDRRQRQISVSRLPADIAAGARKPPQSVKRIPGRERTGVMQ